MSVPERTGRSATILVADDDDQIRELVARNLRQAGFEVVEALDGNEALARFDAGDFDLVILDVLMPAPDGIEVCAAIRNRPSGASVPVLMLTAVDDVKAVTRAFDAGASDFTTKPFSWPVLVHRVHYMLRSKDTLDALRRSEAGLESAQRIARLGNWEWDVEDGHLLCSLETGRLLGLPGNVDATFDDYLERVHPEDAPIVRRALAAALKGDARYVLDHRIVLADGAVRYLHANAEVAFGDDRKAARMYGTLQDITDRKEAEHRIQFLAYYDSLTALPNRLLFNDRVRTALEYAKRRNRIAAVMFLDLDHFKRVNDTMGHTAGDVLLQGVAERLTEALRASDAVVRARGPGDGTVARLGGDEFILLAGDVEKAEDVARIARRVLDALKPPFKIDGSEVFASASLGIALFPQDGQTAEDLLKNADAALYHAKDAGRNTFEFFSPAMNQAAFERLSLESSLRRAVERDEFVLHYQPQVDVRDGRMVGVEALVRWNHPDLGLVPPSHFIPLAEETGLIHQIGEQVLRKACAQFRIWRDEGVAPGRVAVNLSGQQFRQEDLVEAVERTTREAGITPPDLELEITESVLMADAAKTVEILNRLKDRGFRLSIDDFGTGYSSLSYLKRFPMDAFKIDRSFVRDIAADPDDAAIVSTIVVLARTLAVEVIAEGVENPLQREFLHREGCMLMQGYMFGRPAPPDKLARLLRGAIAGHEE